MTDQELILFLCKLIWDDLSDGDVPTDTDWHTIYKELEKRGLDPKEVFPY